MKNLLENSYLVLLVRVFIGLLFVVSSLEKIVDPASFALSIANYKLLPEWMGAIIATVLPWLELLCGFSLLFGALVRGSSFLLSAMLAVFTLAVVIALARGLDISCGCFTQDPTAGKIGWLKVLENATLIVLTLFLYFSNAESFTLLQFLQKSNPTREQSH
jgi:uncharacterized membrane protein YphA (DoxX/SURF4 family)